MDEPSVFQLHHKKTVDHAQNKARLSFDVAHDLFASFEVDLGTRLLLRSLAKIGWMGRSGRILDLGCGYGPLGVTLGALNPECRVTMTDRDLLAVLYARHNAERNGVDLERSVAGLAFDDLGPDGGEPERFDLIVSNIPAKAGDRAITSMVLDAAHFLAPDGLVGVVVIDRIAPLVDRLVSERGTVVARHRSRGYLSLLYRLPRPDEPYRNGFERGLYDRTTASFAVDDVTVQAATVWGLPEFDTPGFSTELAARHLLRARGDRVLFVNPGQGLLPAVLRQARPERAVVLRSRDLLALRASVRNATGLDTVEAEATLRTDTPDGIDLAVYHIPDDQPLGATLAEVRPLLSLPSCIIHGRSALVGRVSQALRLDDHERTRHRGGSSLWYRTGPRHRPRASRRAGRRHR